MREFWGILALAVGLAAQTPLKTIDMPQGGRIVYGTVDGAGDQQAALVAVLRMMHSSCGERPQIRQMFKMRGSDSVGLIFTVVNHPAGNVPVAGLIIAASGAAHRTEAALLSDSASRFGSTLNPMLTKLFSVWHPGGLPAASTASTAARAPAATAHAAPASPGSGAGLKLHTVTASDNSVSIGIPDGWTLGAASGRGTILVNGPEGEVVALNMTRNAVDPTSQWQRQFWAKGGRPLPGAIIYPYHGNLVKAFPDMVQAWRRSLNLGPAKLQIDKLEQVPPPQGAQNEECVTANGQMDPDGKGMHSWSEMMCAILPLDWGGYSITRHQSLFPESMAAQQKTTVPAMIATWKPNAEVLNRQMQEALRQKAADDQAIMAQTQQAIGNIKAIGQRAAIMNDAAQARNEAQHAGYWAQQDANARTNQGFTNYQRDQTVIRDTQYPDEHATVWNQTAWWLERTFPDRIEEVPTSQYIKGQDF